MLQIDQKTSVKDTVVTYGNTSINCLDVRSIKYGYAPIQLDMYTIGSRYFLHLQTKDDTLALNFRSFFRIKKKAQYEKFQSLLNAIWKDTVVRIVSEMVARHEEGKTFSVGDCIVSAEGITIGRRIIKWEDVSFQANYDKLTINSRRDLNTFTNLYYLDTYNAHPLRYFLESKFQQ
jgi:hypothetical protein